MIRPNASLPELLANRDWIHDLARSIVADEHVRDDVVQDAWLTAWRTDTPPTRDARGWLATVVRNFARQRARSEARRTRRERAAARPEAQIPATSLTERAELQQRAVAAVLALPEPGRTLLLERFFEGLGPKALAARHDCPIETIRTRLKTALARVRAKLEREDRAGAWRALVIASPASAWPLAATAGVLLMTMKTKVALTAVGLLLAGGFLYPTLAGPEPAETAVEPDAASAMIASTTPTEQPADRGTAPPAREDAALPATPELHAHLDGLRAGVPWTTRVEMKFDGRDAAGKACTFEQLASFDAGACVVALPAWLRDPQRVHLEVRANDPSYATRHWEFGAEALQTTRERPLLLQAQCAAIITGRVECSEPAPIKVAAYPMRGQPTERPSERCYCDQENTYRLRVPDGPCLIVAVAIEDLTERSSVAPRPRVDMLPEAVRVVAIVGERVEAPLIRIGKGHRLTGRVLRSDGRPFANAGLFCNFGGGAQLSSVGDTKLTWHADDRVGRTQSRARTDADGRFEIEGLPSLEHRLGVGEVPGVIPHLFALTESVTPPANVELGLDAAELTLDVWVDGAPAQAARISIQGNKTQTGIGPVSSPVRIVAARGESYVLLVFADGFEGESLGWTPDNTAAERRLVELRRAPPRVVAFEVQGDSFARVQFWGQPLSAGPLAFVRDPAKTDPHHDRFVFHDLPAGRFRVTVRPSVVATGDDRYLLETTLDVDIPQTGEVVLPLRLRKGGVLRLRADGTTRNDLEGRCEIFDANGARLPMSFTRRTEWGHINSTDGELLPGGPNESVRNLPPGRYHVEVRRTDGRLQTFAVDIVAGERTEIVVE